MTHWGRAGVAIGVVVVGILWGALAAAQWRVQEMPARAQAAVVALPDGRILAIGGTSGDGVLDSTLVYDGVWSEGPALLTARRGGAACVDGAGLVHFVGGYSDGLRDEHEILDPAQMVWEAAVPLPAAGWELACATDGDGVVHVLGGEGRLARHDTWDAGAWTQAEPLPEGRMQHDALYGPDGRLYLVGGGNRDEVLPDLLVWDGVTWERRPGPPVPVRQAGAAWLGVADAFLLVGGSTTYNNNAQPFYDAVQLYDADAQVWRAGPALATPTRELGCVVVEGQVHAVGGRAGDFVGHQIATLGELVGVPTLEVDLPEVVGEGTSMMLIADAIDPVDRVWVQWDIDGEVSDGPFAVLRAPDGDAEIVVVVSATDALGGVSTVSRTVRVDNLPPRFLNDPARSVRPGFLYRFDARAVDAAGPLDPVTVEPVEMPDGAIFEGLELRWSPPVGVVSGRVSLVASDGDGGTAELTWDIAVGTDSDGDGVLDSVDNCPAEHNAAQIDTDGDLAGDACDLDDDDDGLPDEVDNCPLFPGASSDLDGDGLGDICDPDDDNDGVDDPLDATPSGGLGQPMVEPSAVAETAACSTPGPVPGGLWRFVLRR